jgi:hypothetical protein
MKGIIRRLRPSPAMVIACIALLFAMTGAGYAAGMLGPNTVGTKQLKRNAVISSKVKNRSLLAVDFKAGQLPRGAQGVPGTPGANGAPGAQGPPGPTLGIADTTGNVPPAVVGSFLVRTLNVTLPTSGSLLVVGRVRSSTTCAAGSCNAAYGLYVDGNPIAASAARQPSVASTTSPWDNIAVFGIAPNLAAGPHAVTMRVAGEGTWSVINFPDSQLTTVMLGGSGTGPGAGIAGSSAEKTSIVHP